MAENINRNPIPEVMPRIDIFPRLARAGRFIVRNLTVFPNGADESLFENRRGAEAMLDSLQDDAPQLPFEEGGRWTDMGRY